MTTSVTLLGLLIVLGVSGCQRGVRWKVGSPSAGLTEGERQNKPTFVYFRNWYSVECTEFEEQVLKHPDVLRETDAIVCVPLEYDWDRPLAKEWGLDRVPSYAIIAPDGRMLSRAEAPISVERIIRDLQSARAKVAPASAAESP